MYFTFNDAGKTKIRLHEITYFTIKENVISFTVINSMVSFDITYQNNDDARKDFNRIYYSNWNNIRIPEVAVDKKNIVAISADPSDMNLVCIFKNGAIVAIPITEKDKLIDIYSFIVDEIEY